MGVDWNKECGGNYLFMPKIGSPAIKFRIKISRRVDGDSKYNLKTKDGGDCGYHYELVTYEDKVVLVNTWAMLKELARLNVQEGDTIAVQRPARGIYQITKKPIDRPQSNPEKIDLSYLDEINKKHGINASLKEESAWDE